jgi:hypothetical protein
MARQFELPFDGPAPQAMWQRILADLQSVLRNIDATALPPAEPWQPAPADIARTDDDDYLDALRVNHPWWADYILAHPRRTGVITSIAS